MSCVTHRLGRQLPVTDTVKYCSRAATFSNSIADTYSAHDKTFCQSLGFHHCHVTSLLPHPQWNLIGPPPPSSLPIKCVLNGCDSLALHSISSSARSEKLLCACIGHWVRVCVMTLVNVVSHDCVCTIGYWKAQHITGTWLCLAWLIFWCLCWGYRGCTQRSLTPPCTSDSWPSWKREWKEDTFTRRENTTTHHQKSLRQAHYSGDWHSTIGFKLCLCVFVV